MNKRKFGVGLLGLILVTLFTLQLTMAAPPQSTVVNIDRGVDIVHPETVYVALGDDLEFNFWTYNSTNGVTLTNTSLNCTVYFINSSGDQFYRLSNQAGASGRITYGKGAPLCVNCWTSDIGAGNFTNQRYSYQIKCQGPGVGGYFTGYFDVIDNGFHPKSDSIVSDTSISISITILYLSLVLFFILSTLGIFLVGDARGKLALYWVSHLMSIAMLFIGWNIANEFLTSTPFVADFFRILFLIVLIAVLPMFFISLFYIIKFHFINKDVMDLINAGYERDDAERIALRAAKDS